MANRSGNNIEKYNEEFKFNKNAFDDVIGDPFAQDRLAEGSAVLEVQSSYRRVPEVPPGSCGVVHSCRSVLCRVNVHEVSGSGSYHGTGESRK